MSGRPAAEAAPIDAETVTEGDRMAFRWACLVAAVLGNDAVDSDADKLTEQAIDRVHELQRQARRAPTGGAP